MHIYSFLLTKYIAGIFFYAYFDYWKHKRYWLIDTACSARENRTCKVKSVKCFYRATCKNAIWGEIKLCDRTDGAITTHWWLTLSKKNLPWLRLTCFQFSANDRRVTPSPQGQLDMAQTNTLCAIYYCVSNCPHSKKRNYQFLHLFSRPTVLAT